MIGLGMARLRSTRTVLFVLACLLFVAGWPGAVTRPLILELAAPSIPEDVKGRDGVLDVVVSADGAKLRGARVRAFAILAGRAHAAGEAVTDQDGRATLRDLPLAEHWVVAEAEGRARGSQMVVVVAGARRLDLDLALEHTLDVRVRTEDGAPVPRAEIETRGADPFPVGARTDDTGSAHVRRLTEGPYTVRVHAPGFEDVTRRRVAEGTPLEIVLGKKGALVVKVAEDDGAPVKHARVLVASASLWPARVAETGDDGSVRIGGLDAGSYSLRATRGSRASPIELGVVLTRSEEKLVELRLGPGVMVATRVIDGTDDEPIERARVTLAEGGLSPFPLEGVTDKKGRVTLGPIAQGPASLSARADGFVGRGAVRLPEPLEGEVVVKLARGGALVGTVTDTRGYKVDGATIRVVGTDLEGMPIDEDPRASSFRDAHFAKTLAGPTPLLPAGELGVMPGPVPPIPRGLDLAPGLSPTAGEPWVTGRDGSFRATPVTPGRVRAIVTHPQYVEAMSDVVLVSSEKDARVDVVLQRGGALEGRVVDMKGRGVGGVVVTALATRGSLERMIRAASDGSFAFAALPEAVTILVAREDDVANPSARLEVAVPEGGKTTIVVKLPDPRPPLAVRVTGDHDRGIDAAQVTASSLDPNESLRVTAFTNDRGEAELASTKGLPLRVEVRAPGRATRVLVTTAETERLVVALGTAESVTGEITTSRRDAIEGAEVILETDSGTRHARTDREGTFTISDVAPGSARLRVRAKGRAPARRDVTIEERGGRKPTEVKRIELAEEAVVEGIVVDEKGNPVPGARVAKDAVPTYLPTSGPLVGMAASDGRGRFRLGELAEGATTLEAYAADVGRGQVTVELRAGRTKEGIKIVLARGEPGAAEPNATGGVAVTLGETTAAGPEGPEVVVVAVAEGSEAERAGLLANDLLVDVGGARPKSIVDARARLAGPVHDDVLVKVKRGDRVVSLRVAREPVRR